MLTDDEYFMQLLINLLLENVHEFRHILDHDACSDAGAGVRFSRSLNIAPALTAASASQRVTSKGFLGPS